MMWLLLKGRHGNRMVVLSNMLVVPTNVSGQVNWRRWCAHYDRTALWLDDFQYGGRSMVIR